jgi:hypothetical protein
MSFYSRIFIGGFATDKLEEVENRLPSDAGYFKRVGESGDYYHFIVESMAFDDLSSIFRKMLDENVIKEYDFNEATLYDEGDYDSSERYQEEKEDNET